VRGALLEAHALEIVVLRPCRRTPRGSFQTSRPMTVRFGADDDARIEARVRPRLVLSTVSRRSSVPQSEVGRLDRSGWGRSDHRVDRIIPVGGVSIRIAS
jgi:hypothetical protein